MQTPVTLRGVAYHIDETAPIERVAALAKDPQVLAAFQAVGHRTYAQATQSLADQGIASAKKSLAAAKLTAKNLDAIVIGTSEIREPNRYPEMLSTEMLIALGLSDVPVVGVTLAGCANYASSLRVARNMLVAEGMKHVLVVETNQVRGDMKREVYEGGVACAIFADGAASVIVSAEPGGGSELELELAGTSQTVKPLDWKRADPNYVAANNVMGYRHVVDDALARAGIKRADVAKVFLPNMSTVLLADIAACVGLDVPKVYIANCLRTAHVWSCDNLINVADYCAAEDVPAGAPFLLIANAESYFSAVVVRKR